MKSIAVLTVLNAVQVTATRDSSSRSQVAGITPSCLPLQSTLSPISKSSFAALSVRGGDDEPMFFFSEVNSEDFDSDYESIEREHYAHETDNSDSAPVISSSQVLYEGCFVQSEAVIYNEGPPEAFMAGFDYDSVGDSDDEDEDDDDNDGHSSMLSNSSVRRSKVLADGSYSPRSAPPKSTSRASSDVYFESEVRLQKPPTSSFGIHRQAFLRR